MENRFSVLNVEGDFNDYQGITVKTTVVKSASQFFAFDYVYGHCVGLLLILWQFTALCVYMFCVDL